MEAMLMEGIPPWLFWGAVTAVLALSLGVVAYLEGRKAAAVPSDYPKWDLFQVGFIRAAAKARPFQFLLQLPFVFTFFFIIYAGFFGTQVAYLNIGPPLTWTIWWAGLIFVILFLGKVWCLVCPWNAVAQWLQRLTLWGRGQSSLSLGLRWPRRLRNIYLATGLFVGLVWLELGFGVTLSPWATAGLGALMLSLALVPALYFDSKPFCRYGCLVGRVSGLYAMFSALELRSRDKAICRGCRTKDCLRGNEKGYGCPTFEYMGNMELNTYCILCTECLKTCPHDNIALNFRPFATDLVRSRRVRADEAYLAIVMLSMTSFHGITMTPSWASIFQWLQAALSAFLNPEDWGAIVAFTVGMAVILALPLGISRLFAYLSGTLSGDREVPLRRVFLGYAYSLLPLALFYHLAHNLEHLLREGQRIVPLVSDPFGWGWNLFGTAQWQMAPLLPLPTIQYLQVLLVLVGHAYAVYIAYSMSPKLQFTGVASGNRRRGLVPILALLVVFSGTNLWLLAQPMQMRMTAM